MPTYSDLVSPLRAFVPDLRRAVEMSKLDREKQAYFEQYLCTPMEGWLSRGGELSESTLDRELFSVVQNAKALAKAAPDVAVTKDLVRALGVIQREFDARPLENESEAWDALAKVVDAYVRSGPSQNCAWIRDGETLEFDDEPFDDDEQLGIEGALEWSEGGVVVTSRAGQPQLITTDVDLRDRVATRLRSALKASYGASTGTKNDTEYESDEASVRVTTRKWPAPSDSLDAWSLSIVGDAALVTKVVR